MALNPNAFDPQANRLCRQDPSGHFFDDALAAGVSNPQGRSLGVAAIDVGDLGDGTSPRFPTLFITHWVAQENALYQPTTSSTGQLEYRDRSRQQRLAEISIDRVGWGCAIADFDGDGDLDLAIARNRASPLLLENQGPTGNTLGVRLLGSDSQAIGARIELTTAAGSQAAWWRADASFASDHAPEQLFGLGEETSASSLCFATLKTHQQCFITLSSGRTYLLLPN